MKELEERGLLEKVKCVHLNDSKHPLGSRKDRHEHIGMGEIGEICFRSFLNDPRWDDVSGILETPKEDDWDAKNIRKLKELRGDSV
jgi:deoxyribonuclease-4